MTRHTTTLPVRLPSDPVERAGCRRCIEQRLGSRPGILSVRFIPGHNSQDHDHIELEYQAELVSLTQVDGYLRQVGGCLDTHVALAVLKVEGMLSPRQEAAVQAVLSRLPGVQASASYGSQSIRVEYEANRCPLPQIIERLRTIGVRVREEEFTHAGNQPTAETATAPPSAGKPSPPGLAPPVRQPIPQPPSLLQTALHEPEFYLVAITGITLLGAAIIHLSGLTAPPWQVARVALLLISYACGSWYPFFEMLPIVRRLRVNIDVLMFAAAFGAASLGHYEEGALLLFLFSLGGAGERLALGRAQRAIEALSRLAPKTATILDQSAGSAPGQTSAMREVRVEDLRLGDRVFVRPGEMIPADGAILTGASAVDQSTITGESVPVDKNVDDTVFAGTLNGQGVLVVGVTRLAAETTLARVIRLVEEAQTTKSPTQLFTDRIERWYVPLVLAATAAIAIAPPLLQITPRREEGALWAGWFYQAMAFLTAASPCALAIGTPAAVLSGIARAARAGVLIKGGAHLETLGRINAIAFDKTGTLTHGRPAVTHVVPLVSVNEADLLCIAAGLESSSDHPIARAIVNEAGARQCASAMAQDVVQLPGVGIRGRVNGRVISAGRMSMMPTTLENYAIARGAEAKLAALGQTTVAIADDRFVLGLIALADQPRPGVRQMLDDLRDLGVRHTIMLTGDNASTAQAIAEAVGVDQHLADLLPEGKVEAIRKLTAEYGRVAMVGDGVNDAPALASATIGIAVGGATGAGSDVALETADVALLASDMRNLPDAVGISRFARRIITQNLFIALGVIAILAPAAALGRTPISLAVLFHEGSTVVVVLNALRILGYRVRRQ